MPPEIDYAKCIACGTCVNVCAEDVFFGTKGFGKIKDQKPEVTYPEACYHCCLCVRECPAEAIGLRTPLAMHVPYR
jgi:adenylylsulfate reductase subunit B